MVRQAHLIAVVGTFMMGRAVLLFVGCAGGRSEAPEDQRHTEATRRQEQGHTEATKEQTRSPEATESEEARCCQTRTYKDYHRLHVRVFTTNNVPGCPNGGLLSGTDKPDNLAGKDGDDEIRGLGASDTIEGGTGNDVIYGGPGRDALHDGNGEDVIHGGAGNDSFIIASGQRDKVYCGPGKHKYLAYKKEYVDSSCEEELPRMPPPDPGDVILPPPKAGEGSSIPAALH